MISRSKWFKREQQKMGFRDGCGIEYAWRNATFLGLDIAKGGNVLISLLHPKKLQGASLQGDGVFKMGKEVHAPLILKTIEAIQELTLPCETGSEFEFLCDDCPYNINASEDCGLALIKIRATEITDNLERGIIGICPDCGCPATHPSGLCRDCYQAKLEGDEI